MGLQTPGPPEIIRAAQKDNDFIKKIEQEFQEIVQNCFGQRVCMKWKNRIHYGAIGAYYVLTNLSGFQTLGEEYAGILQVNETHSKIPNKSMIAVMILCHTFGRPVMKYTLGLIENYLVQNIQRQQTTCQPSLRGYSGFSDVLGHPSALRRNVLLSCLTVVQIFQHYLPFLSQLHLALFYIQGKFYHLSKRVTGVEYVLVRKWYANQNESSKKNLKYLMWLSLINLMLTAIHDSTSLIENLEQSQVKAVKDKHESNDSLEPEIEASRKCSLCLELRKNSSVTPCGHLFCWDCIADWLRTKNECPICRDKVQPSKIVGLGNYL